MEEVQPSIGSFLVYLEVTFPPEKTDLGEWRVIAHRSVGSIAFGMTREEVRAVLAQPFVEFDKGKGAERTDAFDTLDLHIFYRDDRVEALEFWNASNVWIGGHRLSDETFADLELIFFDPVQPLVVTPTSIRSPAFGAEFSIESADQRETLGAIKHIILVTAGYFEQQAALLAEIDR